MNYTPEQIALYQQYIQAGYSEQDALAGTLQQIPSVAPVAAPVTIDHNTQSAVAGAIMQAPAPSGLLGALTAIADAGANCDNHGEVRANLPRQGIAWLRILAYIEYGVQKPSNPTYSPSQQCAIVFELHHPDHAVEYDGIRQPRTLTVTTNKSHGANSGFPKLFKALNSAFGGKYENIGQMVGDCLLGEISHNKGNNGTTYANLDNNGAWSFKSTTFVNPADGTQSQVDVPALFGEPMLFLMDNPDLLKQPQHVKAMWDSLYIEGEREVQIGGVKETRSRNVYQSRIMRGLNWQASETKKILDSLGCTTMTADAMQEIQQSQAPVATNPVAAPVQQAAVAPPVQPAQVVPTPQVQPVAQVQPTLQPAAMPAMPGFQPTPAPIQQAPVAQFNQAAMANFQA